ncbi:hypothetical protein M758_12G010000 [Ceratodon purpureus]|uniref:Uncharacterized protein n=1 Tax=Ceratodon purpureus TaxID=3225 RepID=A0A8T0G5P6_CERPU|nr:hypothetical protein KC19_12G009400 [Ceratodon purpureus]KAG0553409.1 hypothetical protein KC19_12G009400 [Ceratodon purpureus]KAG0597630.1 hypothetical protein M758_12G010000 [Ceratodon purpureus]
MAANNVNWGVVVMLLTCYIIAFGLAIAAEEHRAQATVTYVSLNSSGGNVSWVFDYQNKTILSNGTYSGYYYCKYDSDISSSYAVAAFTFLAIAQVIVMGLTKCLCFDGEHRVGSTKSCAIVSYILLWLCFMIAEICFLAGANKNSIRSSQKELVTGNQKIDQYLTCENMHRGIFGAAAAFTFFSALTGELYYVCIVLSRSVAELRWQGGSGAGPGSNSSMNRSIPSPYALGSEDTRGLNTQANDSFYGTNRGPGGKNKPQTQMTRNPMPSPYSLT